MAGNHKIILWDLDGTLCPHNARFMELAPQAVATAALDFSIPMKPDDALQLARSSFKGQRASIMAFVERFGLVENEVFTRYYHHLDPGFIVSSPDLISAFRHLTRHKVCGVLTQAPETWAAKALDCLRLGPYFSEDLIIGHTRMKGARKADAEGCARLAELLRTYGYAPMDVALVDDKLPVLQKLEPCARIRIWLQDQPDEFVCPHGLFTATTPLEAVSLLAEMTDAD